MNKIISPVVDYNPFWVQFFKKHSLTDNQQAQFVSYMQQLCSWNQRINLTRIMEVDEMISRHFEDSLAVKSLLNIKKGVVLCDVGSGGGFPGIPLKICYPEARVILIEVQQKKVAFLRAVIRALQLKNIDVCDLDWRTFLRTKPYSKIDYVLARASLKPIELLRMFKPSGLYRNAALIYWASVKWRPSEYEKHYIVKKSAYTIGDRQETVASYVATKFSNIFEAHVNFLPD
jgi:16S rRNA (guanine527-N7)-methyltransferase